MMMAKNRPIPPCRRTHPLFPNVLTPSSFSSSFLFPFPFFCMMAERASEGSSPTYSSSFSHQFAAPPSLPLPRAKGGTLLGPGFENINNYFFATLPVKRRCVGKYFPSNFICQTFVGFLQPLVPPSPPLFCERGRKGGRRKNIKMPLLLYCNTDLSFSSFFVVLRGG